METNYYCIQCKDKRTGKIGDFVHNGDFYSVSPVFDSLMDLFAWAKENNKKLEMNLS